jgi:hypothetical protein
MKIRIKSTLAVSLLLAVCLASPAEPQGLSPAVSDQGPYSTFSAACSAAVAADRPLLISRKWVSIPTQTCSAHLIFYSGARLQPDTNAVLTIDGSLVAGTFQIFDTETRRGSAVALSSSGVREIYPQWWGALGNNSHDDTKAMNAAFAAGVATGVPVEIPEGIYLCNTATHDVILNFLSDTNPDLHAVHNHPGGITIRGDGRGNTIIKTTAAGADLMAAISSTVNFPSYDIQDITLLGPDQNAVIDKRGNGVSGYGLRISGAASPTVRLRNVLVQNFYGTGKAAIWLDNVENSQLDSIRANYSDIGLKMTNDYAININLFAASLNKTYGLDISVATELVFNAPVIQGTYVTGAYLDQVVNCTFVGMHLEANNSSGTGHGLDLESTRSPSNANQFIGLGNYGSANDILINATESHPIYNNHFYAGNHNSFNGFTVPLVTLSNARSTGQLWDGFDARLFTGFTGNEILLHNGLAGVPTSFFPTLNSNRAILTAQPFAKLPRCGTPVSPEGSSAAVTDSTVDKWGAKISGSGTNHVRAYCNGTSWVVD